MLLALCYRNTIVQHECQKTVIELNKHFYCVCLEILFFIVAADLFIYFLFFVFCFFLVYPDKNIHLSSMFCLTCQFPLTSVASLLTTIILTLLSFFLKREVLQLNVKLFESCAIRNTVKFSALSDKQELNFTMQFHDCSISTKTGVRIGY